MQKIITALLNPVESWLGRTFNSSTPEALLPVIVILAATVRFTPIISSSFPINDGGFIYSMISDLQNNNFLLPHFASYNQAHIPFTYPPLTLYLGVFLSGLGLPLITVFRFLPPLVSLLTVILFFHFASLFCQSRTAGLIAAFAFAMIPKSYVMLIMGGGFTRSFGLLFYLACLIFTYHFFSRPSYRFLLSASAAFTLTILSHPEWALSSFVSIVLLGFYLPPPGFRIRSILKILILTLIFCSPWIIFLLTKYGPIPLISALHSGFWDATVFLPFLPFFSTSEPILPLFAIAGLVCTSYLVLKGKFFLPLWIFISFLSNPRTFGQSTIIPLSLAIGLIFSKHFLPHLRLSPPFPYLKASLALIVLLLPYLTASLFNYSSQSRSLTPNTVSAMKWARYHTPANARFLVLSSDTFFLWSYDKTAEWFPALSQKISLTTAQGLEWLPNNRFFSLLNALDLLKPCASQGISCFEAWSKNHQLDFTHIFISDPESSCCSLLRHQLDSSPAYTRIFQNSDTGIWVKNPL